ncbi:type II secretion system F family protein [Variovorax ginsengisoli]|uniref:Tight adherence protein C n=1 Tax=Variovorax ginsengisoli TaxID=363844 RepID=A0ABT9SEB6_9BURK|nr:type II secretion system F family protein [Variovorax ginsengisoli]MDP9902709.1 tight adherence protein C [Variovorax ginsengisoli]
MTADQLTVLSLSLFALGLLIAAGLLVLREVQRARSGQTLGRAIQRGLAAQKSEGWQPANKAPLRTSADDAPLMGTQPMQELPAHWLQSGIGRALVADEDRRLIDQCGFESVRAQLGFLVIRSFLALALPALGYVAVQTGTVKLNAALVMAFACIVGFMAPKWVLGRIAAGRREQVAGELPLFVDLLRLLQGVGLSLDQSLQIMADDFGHVLRILAKELAIANRQYGQGRTREHSLQRLASLHDNENLAGLVALLVQVDRHGGAVQEPLHQFSERLRESRRSELKGRIGRITVKMTGVMVTTLLPALIIVTAGPGFLAVIRSLGAIAK